MPEPEPDYPLTVARCRYSLPLREAWVDSHGRLESREGWLVRIRAGDQTGYGDCAPLPSLGTETLDAAGDALASLSASLSGRSLRDAFAGLPRAPGPAPAARCGVETALADLAARAAGRPMAHWLAGDAGSACRVNGVLGPVGPALRRARAGLPESPGVWKVKVAVAAWSEEQPLLEQLVGLLPPGARLRLDANGGWTRGEAARILPVLAGWPVDSLEEPVRGAGRDELRQLQDSVDFPLALDESLTLQPELADAVERQVLKPMLLGGPLATLRRARRREKQTVVTSSIESAVGVWAAVHTAAALNNDLAHGLATSGWLARDLAAAPAVVAGRISLAGESGLGVVPTTRARWVT
jgi:o-succinylbenzoate synthase